MKTVAGVAADQQAGPCAGWLRFFERSLTDPLIQDRSATLCASTGGRAHGDHRRRQGDGHPGWITPRAGETSGQLARLLLDSLSRGLARRTDGLLSRQFTRMVPKGALGRSSRTRTD
jgi:hypothetical protein